MEAQQQGQSWSEKNPIPSVAGFLDEQRNRSNAPLSAPPGPPRLPTKDGRPSTSAPSGADEKKEMMDKANAGKENPVKSFESKGWRTVVDPVTGVEVEIKDAESSDFANQDLYSRDALDPSKDTPGPAASVGYSQDTSVHKTAPNPINPGNILLREFPPPVLEDGLANIYSVISRYTSAIMAALAVIALVVVIFGRGGFIFKSIITSALAALGGSVYVAHGIVARKLEKELQRIRLHMHRERGANASSATDAPLPESTEWMNALVQTIWKQLNPDLFIALTDTIEDVIQASLPGFVDAVKIADFSLGKNALRIVSMRGLPDQPGSKEYPREEWIDQGVKTADTAVTDAAQDAKTEQDLDQSGDYVNMEISFAYSSPPGKSKAAASNDRISLLMEFYLGAYDWVHVPIPIWIAVEEIVGTIRLRMQIVSDAPFVRNLTFTLMGVPHVEASAIPMIKLLPNVLDLPLVSSFVQSSIAAASSIYVAPKSMTMNLMQMMSGDGIKKDTKALGVLQITIKHAVDLSAQDTNGFSDPYVVVAFAKYGKPLYSTRIIARDLNPVWEETFFLLVSDDEVKAQESLSLQLWDSDVRSADDLVGRVSVPLLDLMKAPGELKERKDKLMGFEDADEMSGELYWTVGYFDKAALNPKLKKEAGVDHSLPTELQSRPELKVEVKDVDTAEESDVMRTPPDSRYPAGILSIIVHQINNLERKDVFGSTGKDREGKAGQDTDAPTEEMNNLPSGYCEIIVNDNMVFKTRVKQYSTMPFYEAGTEIFVRDWQEAVVRVVVRDSRLREHDPILGIVDLNLPDILAHSSQVTRLFALQGGVGFGRVNISVLFKSVELTLPRNLRGWETGTACILSHVKVEPVAGSTFEFGKKKLKVSTNEADQKLPGSSVIVREDGGLEWEVQDSIRLPAYNRFASTLFFDYGGGMTVGPLGTATEAFAALALADLVDDVPSEIRIPIITSNNMATLRHNTINEQTKKTHDFEIVGWLTTTVLLDSGLDGDHEEYAETQTKRHEFETYDQAEGQAVLAEKNATADDDGVIDKEEAAQIKAAHAKALRAQHRGPMQFRAVRTAKWSKDGMMDRVRRAKQKVLGGGSKEETVASEAV